MKQEMNANARKKISAPFWCEIFNERLPRMSALLFSQKEALIWKTDKGEII